MDSREGNGMTVYTARVKKIDLHEMREILERDTLITTRMKPQQIVDKVVKANGLQLQNLSAAEVQFILSNQLLMMIMKARDFGLLDEPGEEAYVPISRATEVMQILSKEQNLLLVSSGLNDSQYLFARALGCYDYMIYFETADYDPSTQYSFMIEPRFKSVFAPIDYRSFSRLNRNQRMQVMDYMRDEVQAFIKSYDTWYVNSSKADRDKALRAYIAKTYPELQTKFETVI